MSLLSTYGIGRIFFVGNSSPSDNGTGDTGDTGDSLFNGWFDDSPTGLLRTRHSIKWRIMGC